MANRPQIDPHPVFDATTGQSMAVNITGKPTIIQKHSMISYAFDWNGTAPVGAISLEISNDFELNPNGSVKNAGIWNVLPLNLNGAVVNSVPVSGNAGDGFIDIGNCSAYAIRPKYTATSGTGTISAIIVGKVS